MRKITSKRLLIITCVLICILMFAIIMMKLRPTKKLIISGDRNIFFIETSHINKEMITLTPRQGCAVESAARMNPRLNIYLLIFTPPSTYYSDDTKYIIAQFSKYQNINVRPISLENYLMNSPMELWWNKTHEFTSSHWFILRISDFLKYLALWKYGGIYLDLDVVVKSSLEDLRNFVGAEDTERIGTGVIGFDSSDIGREYANMCLQESAREFQNVEWSYKNPTVITRFVRKICATKYYDETATYVCNDQTLTVFKPSIFYPIPFEIWKDYFDEKNKDKTMAAIKGAKAIHVWNEHSYSERIKVGSDAPYALTAGEYCPNVYYNSVEYF